MNAGAFGFGLAGIGIGGIRRIEDMGGVPVDFGEMQYWWGKLTISYAILLGRGLSVGANFNEHRQVLGPFSTYGFGIDAGLHFAFQQKQGLFKNLNLGINMDNALPVRLKLGTVVENMSYTIHFGVAKVITLRNNEDSWLLIGDVDQTENKETRTHFGTEYSWNERFFLRAGIDN